MNTPANVSFNVKQQAAIEHLSTVKESDVKEIAVTQLKLLSQYYELSLSHANRSFRVALVAGIVGLGFFLWVVLMLAKGQGSGELASAGLIGGAISEFIAGVNFMLYSKTLDQLNLFQGKLENTQRFLLANSLCESLEQKHLKEYTRARLIGSLVGLEGDNSMRELVDVGGAHGQTEAANRALPVEEGEVNMTAMRPL